MSQVILPSITELPLPADCVRLFQFPQDPCFFSKDHPSNTSKSIPVQQTLPITITTSIPPPQNIQNQYCVALPASQCYHPVHPQPRIINEPIQVTTIAPPPALPKYQIQTQPAQPPLPSEQIPEKKAKGPWTTSEDKLLLDAMASFSGHICWEELSKMIPGRSAKQCRERWQYRLHPDVNKAPFEPWEDELIIYERNYNASNWPLIASKLPGRTSCAVKNRWYTVLRNRRPDQTNRRAKICPIQVSPFYLETVILRNRKELWEREKPSNRNHHT